MIATGTWPVVLTEIHVVEVVVSQQLRQGVQHRCGEDGIGDRVPYCFPNVRVQSEIDQSSPAGMGERLVVVEMAASQVSRDPSLR